MRLILKFVKWLALLIAALLVIGFFLPAQYGTMRKIVINAPPEKITALLDAPKAWVQWSPWNKADPNMKITYSGPERGVGAKSSWISKSEGNGSMEMLTAEPGKRVAYELRMDGMGAPSMAEFLIKPVQGGQEVSWTMKGEHGMNPIHRWFSLFMDKLVGPYFEQGLQNIKQMAEKS